MWTTVRGGRSRPAGPVIWLDQSNRDRRKALLDVEQWAEIRRMKHVERLSQREIHRFLPPPRSFQRTVYRLGELVQFDLCEPRSEIPVGFGQTCRGYIVTCELPYSRAFARPADLARTRARERGGNFVRAREPGDWPRAAVQSS